ncbi:MAG: hypothetical protein AB1489_34755 [Acidobacteriota bacterium]
MTATAPLSPEQLQKEIVSLARRLSVPSDSYLLNRLDFDDPDQLKLCIDGLTLAFISYCYHKHPRGENVYEVMELIEEKGEHAPDKAELETRAEAAAALEIPFIVKLNGLLEDYYLIRHELEQFIMLLGGEDSVGP